MYSCDENVAEIDTEQRVTITSGVQSFVLNPVMEALNTMVLPEVVKASLILAQMKAHNQKSLSVNARMASVKEHTVFIWL